MQILRLAIIVLFVVTFFNPNVYAESIRERLKRARAEESLLKKRGISSSIKKRGISNSNLDSAYKSCYWGKNAADCYKGGMTRLKADTYTWALPMLWHGCSLKYDEEVCKKMNY